MAKMGADMYSILRQIDVPWKNSLGDPQGGFTGVWGVFPGDWCPGNTHQSPVYPLGFFPRGLSLGHPWRSILYFVRKYTQIVFGQLANTPSLGVHSPWSALIYFHPSVCPFWYYNQLRTTCSRLSKLNWISKKLYIHFSLLTSQFKSDLGLRYL